jgi:type IV secretory pathway VirB4 component
MHERYNPVNAHSMSELLPWLFVADARQSTVVCKDSSLLASWSMTGIDIESGEDGLIEHACGQLDSAFRRLADAGSTVWATMERRPASAYIRGVFDNPVADYIDELWGSSFAGDRPLFVNKHYLSAAMQTKGNAVSLGEMVGQGLSEGMKLPAAILAALRGRTRQKAAIGFANRTELEAMCRRFENSVASVLDNAVTHVQLQRLHGPDLLGVLKASASVNPEAPVAFMEDEYLDTYLSDTFLDNSMKDYLVLEGGQQKYVGVFTLKGAPPGSLLQGLNPLMALPVHLRVGVCWKAATLAEAEKFLSSARTFDEMRGFTPKKLFKMAVAKDVEMSGDDTPTTRVGAVVESFRDDARRREAFFGWMASTVLVYADTPELLGESMDMVARALERSGLVYLRETDGSLSGFCACIPGHLREIVRWHFVEASNLTDTVPLVSLDSGVPYHPFFSEGAPEPVPPNAILRTRYNTVQYFNYHVGQLGHTLVIGPARNGKTMFQMFLESQFLKYPNARIFNLDKDLSCKPTTLLLGGTHIDLDPSHGHGLKMNPVGLAVDEPGRAWLVGWIDRILTSRGKALTDAEIEEVYQALTRIAVDPMARMTTLLTQLPDHLRVRLTPWCEGGAYGMYFDHVEDEFSVSQVTTTEVGSLINAGLFDVVRAYADYAFYRIERFLSDRTISELGPTMIYFEEAGFLLDDPVFANKARDYLMTLPKKRAFLVMTAQSPEPFLNQPALGAAVRDNIATIIFLPNQNAGRPELARKYKEAFGVNDTQLDLIAGATPKMEYCIYQPQTGLFRVAQAQFTPEIVACLRSDAKSQAVFNRHYDPENPQWKENYLSAVLNA